MSGNRLVKFANVGVGLVIARKGRAEHHHGADLAGAAISQLAGEHPAQAPPDEQHLAPLRNRVEPAAQQLHRILPGAHVHPHQQRVRAPSATRQRPAQIHRRPVGGQKSGDHQGRRPLLGSARAERPKPGEQARQMPYDFADAVPRRRRQRIGIDRDRRAHCRRGLGSSFPLHAPKMECFRYRNKYLW